ncbi:hypothetical protein ACS0TY_008540 [Phlomoides rotata]
MVLSNKKLKQKYRAVKAELIAASEAGNNLTDKIYEKSRDFDSKASVLNLDLEKLRLSKREKRRQRGGKENAEVISNGELSGGLEPKKQDGPNSGDVKVKNNKRKRGESEASENVKEKKPQLKKKKKKRKKKKAKKVESGKIKEERLEHNESGSSGLQPVVKTEESIERKNVETSLKIYVGGIPYYSTEDDIRSYFEGCGTITSIDCMTFPDSGKFRGIAIITYKTEAAAKRALALDGSDMGGLFLKIQPYKSATVNKLPNFSPSVVDGYNRIYIGNLSWDITEDDLRKLFTDCTVTSIRFGKDKETGEFKGYAHVDFADGLSLNTALKLDQTIVYGRPVRISCAVSKNAAGTKVIPLPKDNQEDSGKKGNTTILESTPKDNEVGKSNVSVIENQGTSSGTNDVSSKIRRRTCYECGERGHLSSACPKKLASDSTIPGQMTVSYAKNGTGTTLIPLPKDNQEDSWKKGNTTEIEATPRYNKVDRNNVFLVENQVTSSGTDALSSKIRRRTCYECGERGHLSSSCPKKLAADFTNPALLIDNQDDSGKKQNFTKFESTPRDYEVDRSNVSVVVENQVSSSGANALSSKIRRRTCYECGERGHLSSSCPKKLAADSINPGMT